MYASSYLGIETPFKEGYAAIAVATDLTQLPCDDAMHEPLTEQRYTQLQVGETIQILQEKLPWVFVSALHQLKWDQALQVFKPYHGWMRRDCLELAPVNAPNAIITSHQASLRREPSFDSPIIATPTMASIVTLHEMKNGWHRISCGRLQGWIYDTNVSLFNWMQGADAESWRWQWIETAKRYNNYPYVWGGLDIAAKPTYPRGLDCSGFLHLCARRLGLIFPRDAKDQYRWLRQLGHQLDSFEQMQPADLVFLSHHSWEQIDHVMLYLGDEQWLECSVQTGGFYHSLMHQRIGEIVKVIGPDESVTQYLARAQNKKLFFCRGLIPEGRKDIGVDE